MSISPMQEDFSFSLWELIPWRAFGLSQDFANFEKKFQDLRKKFSRIP